MRLKQKIRQHRRDFKAIYQCEHCGHEMESHGYDDAYFHNEVIPKMVCLECGKAAPENAPRTAPDVPADQVL